MLKILNMLGALALSGLSIAGCSSPAASMKTASTPEPQSTPAKSVTSLYSLYSKTIDHLDEKGWDAPPADATVLGIPPQNCSLANGANGVTYSGGGHGPGHADPVSASAIVADFWKASGLKTSITRSSNPRNDRITVGGFDSVLTAQYVVNGNFAYVEIVTTCVPGNSQKLTEEVQKHREQQSSAPSP